MFDRLVTATAGASGAGAVDAWTRVESAACARRLAAMVAMLDTAYAADGSADRDQWCLDNWAAVCAHIGAAQRLTPGATSGLLLVATALHDRYPQVGAVFTAGLITYQLARAIVYRGLNVTDPGALHAIDTALARALRTWEPMSVDKTEQAIDAFIERFDPHALRRSQTQARSRSLDVTIDDGSGLATLFGTLFATDALAFDARLDALADTVCTGDPRTRDQRRADAAGALAHGADRLTCLCDTAQCNAAQNPPAGGVIIHVVAHRDTITTPPRSPEPVEPSDPCPDEHPADEETDLDGSAPPRYSKPLRDMTITELLDSPRPSHCSTIRPAVIMGGPFLPGSIARRAAHDATLVPINHPGLAPPEPRHPPSKSLADFVRSRDLTCRFPGCRVPATNCDVDHTIPWPDGPTCGSNLKCLCRKHHLLKTFWAGEVGWRDRQHPDGAVDWTAPDGAMHTTTPGSRLSFPELCEPTAPVTATGSTTGPKTPTAGLTMPRRKTTRAQDRARRIARERDLNCLAAQSESADPDPPF